MEILNTHNVWVVTGISGGKREEGVEVLVEERIKRSNMDLITGESPKGEDKINGINQETHTGK